MFKIEPEVFTVKDVARTLRITPSAVRKSIVRTGAIRGVKVKRSKGMILFSRDQFQSIVQL